MARPTAQPSRRYRGSVKALSSISRVNLLRELQTRGPQTIDELAAATGLHHNTAREHLHLLMRAGYVRAEAVHRRQKGRPRLRYRTSNQAPLGEAPATDSAPLDTDHEDTDHDGTENLNRQLDALNSHLNVCGFAATLQPGDDQLTIRDCPYSHLARDNPQVCQVHHALVQGALDTAGGPLESPDIHPFTGTNECTVDIDGNSDITP